MIHQNSQSEKRQTEFFYAIKALNINKFLRESLDISQCMQHKVSFLLLTLLLTLSFVACDNKNDFSENDIQLPPMTIVFRYFDVNDGTETNYQKEFKSISLKELINDWINVMSQNSIEYGQTDDGTSILKKLKVNYVTIVDKNITVDFNNTFLDFDKVESQVGYFLIGLDTILKQTTDAEILNITIDGSAEMKIIHPDGIMIRNVKLTK